MEGTDFGDEPWNANLSVDAEAFKLSYIAHGSTGTKLNEGADSA
jgi:hypothetical protein